MTHQTDILIVGGGAAGLTAGIFAGEAAKGRDLHIAILEGARKPGAKILVSGGGRCNVTNEKVTADDFNGATKPAIRKVLKAFNHHRTLQWMKNLGVELKLEPTGKYFPQTDKARTVLDALLKEVQAQGVALHSGTRVKRVEFAEDVVNVYTDDTMWTTRKLIVATGGKSLPKSGSDGWGYGVVEGVGHSMIEPVPALVPLVLNNNESPGGRLTELSGLTTDLRLGLYGNGGKCLYARTASLLMTHFGVSGPAALDFSRHWIRDGESSLAGLGIREFDRPEDADAWLLQQAKTYPKKAVSTAVGSLLPERLAELLTEGMGRLGDLPKKSRREMAERLTRLPLSIQGPRGWSFAETTAGGVDLQEVDVRTMESRKRKGLYLCGEILDVDGRIGGFNFQWAWATGYLAGCGAIASLRGS